MEIVLRFGCVLPTMAPLCWCIGSEEAKCIHQATKDRRIVLIPGIHYFDAHRLQPLLLQALALQVHMRESSLVGPEGAGEQVDNPLSDEEQSTTASETEAESEDDDEARPPEEPWCAAVTSCVSRSFDFCAMTKRNLFRDRTPFTITTIAMARGGLSWELNGVSRPHSRTASASDGTCLGSWNWTVRSLRV